MKLFFFCIPSSLFSESKSPECFHMHVCSAVARLSLAARISKPRGTFDSLPALESIQSRIAFRLRWSSFGNDLRLSRTDSLGLVVLVHAQVCSHLPKEPHRGGEHTRAPFTQTKHCTLKVVHIQRFYFLFPRDIFYKSRSFILKGE